MLREINSDAPVHTQVVHEMDTVAIVFNTIGKTENCQDACFQLRQRNPMIGLLRIS
jgi:hypothetical protein